MYPAYRMLTCLSFFLVLFSASAIGGCEGTTGQGEADADSSEDGDAADNNELENTSVFDYGPGRITKYKKDGDSWIPIERRLYAYDDHGRIESLKSELFSETIESWLRDTLVEYQYSEEGGIDYLLSYWKDDISPCSRHSYEYSEDGTLRRVAVLNYVDDHGVPSPVGKPQEEVSYEYDSCKRLGCVTFFHYEDDKLVPRQKQTFSYREEDSWLLLKLVERPDNEVWLPKIKYSYIYDGDGHLDLVTKYDMVNNDWRAGLCDKYEFSGSGRLKSTTHGDCTSGSFEPSGKITYSYDASGQLAKKMSSVLVAEEWQDSSKEELVFTGEGSSHTFEIYPGPLREWLLETYGQGEINKYSR